MSKDLLLFEKDGVFSNLMGPPLFMDNNHIIYKLAFQVNDNNHIIYKLAFQVNQWHEVNIFQFFSEKLKDWDVKFIVLRYRIVAMFSLWFKM